MRTRVRSGELPRDELLNWRKALTRTALGFALIVGGAVAPMALEQRGSGPSMPVGATGDNQCWTYKPSERGFARKINAARVGAGKRKLSLDPELSRVARKHTKVMAAEDLLHHQSSTELRRRVLNWSTLGENVGVGFSVDTLHIAFMNSPAHRHNIMYSSFRHSGVGVIQANGRMWVTVLFEATSDPGTPLNMPRC
ncbi:MAG: CAP domain-containing protein [Actinomycetota bacterium]